MDKPGSDGSRMYIRSGRETREPRVRSQASAGNAAPNRTLPDIHMPPDLQGDFSRMGLSTPTVKALFQSHSAEELERLQKRIQESVMFRISQYGLQRTKQYKEQLKLGELSGMTGMESIAYQRILKVMPLDVIEDILEANSNNPILREVLNTIKTNEPVSSTGDPKKTVIADFVHKFRRLVEAEVTFMVGPSGKRQAHLDDTYEQASELFGQLHAFIDEQENESSAPKGEVIQEQLSKSIPGKKRPPITAETMRNRRKPGKNLIR